MTPFYRLFLNKCDLLKRKLEAGVRLRKYVTGYGDRMNEYNTVLAFFKSKFQGIRKQYSDPSREVYIYTTCVTVRVKERRA